VIEYVTFVTWVSVTLFPRSLTNSFMTAWSLSHIFVAWCSCTQALVQVCVGGYMCVCMYMCVDLHGKIIGTTEYTRPAAAAAPR